MGALTCGEDDKIALVTEAGGCCEAVVVVAGTAADCSPCEAALAACGKDDKTALVPVSGAC